MLSDIEISQQAQKKNITEIGKKLNLTQDDLELYGNYKAKISYKKLQELENKELKGKLILVTAITPTPAGEGKSTVSIGLADALNRLEQNAILALREPSLGPCFGVKGGATGGGYAQITPMEEINLHFTGDIHAITAANNLLAAMIDNHIKQGNELNLDPQNIYWHRCLDLNDRSLREITIAQGGKINGVVRKDSFDISVASEIMAILCLSENIKELKERLSNIVIGKDNKGKYITAKDIKAVGAMAALLKDALKPNLVQTLEQTPALVHGGPFANIAHGCNSLIATKTALRLADYVVTEAGFGADLGAEKFLDIKCPLGGLTPQAIVIVATIRALKMHGGVSKEDLEKENLPALEDGFCNLKTHIENIKKFNLTPIVAINKFNSDTEKEINLLQNLCTQEGIKAITTTVWVDGGKGAETLAQEVIAQTQKAQTYQPLYDYSLSPEEKIECIAKEIYRVKSVDYSDNAKQKLNEIKDKGYANLPVCIAKTQNSISGDAKRLGAPKDHILNIKEIRLAAGAGFIIAISGTINTMPGLPPHPAAEKIDINDKGEIIGLF